MMRVARKNLQGWAFFGSGALAEGALPLENFLGDSAIPKAHAIGPLK